jgi:hypothetical protein
MQQDAPHKDKIEEAYTVAQQRMLRIVRLKETS